MKKPREILKLYTEALSHFRKPSRPAVYIKDILANYSLIKTNSTWTRYDPRFCSAFEPHKTHHHHLNTNLIDGRKKSSEFFLRIFFYFYLYFIKEIYAQCGHSIGTINQTG